MSNKSRTETGFAKKRRLLRNARQQIESAAPKFNYNTKGLDAFKRGEEFLGLFEIDGEHEVRILFLANEQVGGYRFLTFHGSQAPHYTREPIAWARLPTP